MANFIDDIPEAQRDTLVTNAEPVQTSRSAFTWVLWLLLAAGLGLGGGLVAWFLQSGGTIAIGSETTASGADTVNPDAANPATDSNETEPNAEPPTAPATAETAASSPTVIPADGSAALLGHRPYDIADESALVAISTNAMVRLKPDVAQKVETMMAEAKTIGISLDVISGFRSLEDQQYLFFDLKAERGQTAQTRAEVSAPPGYSEHHTGYAVDFIDLSQPTTELNASFEDTPAFRWLEQNAAFYGFEMSFPKGNDQNVAYEPWHWRYVGNQESLELFYQD